MEKLLKDVDPTDPLNPTEDETSAAETATEEAYMVTSFPSGLNNARYGALLKKLHNAFCMGHDK